ncbi:hypothetical protein C461_08764 [Halorubrum aidingense JCM 13560]|uniref:Uncharacterized protein n=1 Tax=Halorubrum aidingense JCM 13560 TaxID=1230454 RepID=M0PCP2_9EURY|nr:hypothetical protein [Halorubrum aidingense]EMA67806.1 hypothetical protein C461_08764 [Halorubrum aidingense JCM 13560]
MVPNDTRSVGELEGRIETFDSTPPATLSDEECAQLTDALVALADAYGARGEFDAEAELIARLDRLRAARPGSDVDIHLASALANATEVHGRADVYETAIDPDRLEAYRDRIEELYERRPEPVIAAPLARATAQTVHANGTAERPGRIGPLLDRLETVYDAHPEPDVAASLLRAYAHAELYLGADSLDADSLDADSPDGDSGVGEDDREDGAASHEEQPDGPNGDGPARDRLARAEDLFKTHPDGEVAAGLAGILAGRTNADAKRTDVETIEDRIGRIEALADRYPAHESEITRWLPVATANATRASFEVADVGRVEHWAAQTADYHERLATASSATWAAVATFFSARASFYDGDVAAGEEKLERLEALDRRYDNPVFAHWRSRAMFDAARAYVETNRPERARETAAELAAFAVGHEDREAIESGLESLYAHAPQMFDEERFEAETETEAGSESDAPADDESRAADHEIAVEPTSSVGAPGDAPGETAADATASSTDDGSGCGSCGDDGCGSCGSDRQLAEPASLPVLAAAAAALAVVVLSVAYTLYRAAGAAKRALDRS